jgi:hypothetical protein
LKKLSVSIAAIALVAMFSCKQKSETPQTATSAPAAGATQTLPPGHPPVDASMQAAAGKTSGTITGKVIEAKNAAGFTYLNLQTPDGPVWAAIPQTTIEAGKDVTLQVSMVTQNFESKALGRKFDSLVFATLPGAAAMPAGHGGAEATPAETPAPAATSVDVPKAEGGKTVAEVWAEKASLKDKPVRIRGKVVKFLPGIMGRNWLHLRDGSGDPAKKTDDITVTTKATVHTGDVVVVDGTVRTGKDFGAGYAYEVIVEDATVAPR